MVLTCTRLPSARAVRTGKKVACELRTIYFENMVQICGGLFAMYVRCTPTCVLCA